MMALTKGTTPTTKEKKTAAGDIIDTCSPELRAGVEKSRDTRSCSTHVTPLTWHISALNGFLRVIYMRGGSLHHARHNRRTEWCLYNP